MEIDCLNSFLIILSIQFGLSVCESEFPLLIVISFDGFRYDYMDKAYTPTLDKLKEEGVVGKWMKNAFITKTFPNHYSIATGFYEESHGIIGNQMYDPLLNDTFTFSTTDTKWWDNGIVIPLWVANQMENPLRFSGGMMWPGTNAKIHNQTAFYHQEYNKIIPWEKRIDIIISWLMNDSNPANCLFLYFDQPDGMGHKFGPDSNQVKKEIIRADNLIGYLIEKLKEHDIYKKTNLIILSDHGMSDVPENHLINIDDIVNSSLYIKYGSTPVWNILPKQGQTKIVYEKLMAGSKTQNFTVYYKEDIPDVYHYRKHHRVMPIVIIANVGYGFIKTNESTEGKRGQHGYNNSVPEMWPIFIAHGPVFQQNYTSNSFHNVDLYPLMCYILQIKCIKTNGSLIHVWNMLNSKSMAVSTAALPTVWIVGIVCLLVLCIAGGITVIVVTSIRRQNASRSEFDMPPVLSTAVRTDKNNSSFEEQQQLLFDPVFDD